MIKFIILNITKYIYGMDRTKPCTKEVLEKNAIISILFPREKIDVNIYSSSTCVRNSNIEERTLIKSVVFLN